MRRKEEEEKKKRKMLWYGLYHGNDLVVTNIEGAHSLFVQVILSVHDDTNKFKSEIHC